jgi:hypothetical protein
MSHRMQVLLDEREFREYRQVARRKGVTVAEWVRQTLRSACRSEPLVTRDRKLTALRKATEYQFPAPDPAQMLAEIELGYHAGHDTD